MKTEKKHFKFKAFIVIFLTLILSCTSEKVKCNDYLDYNIKACLAAIAIGRPSDVTQYFLGLNSECLQVLLGIEECKNKSTLPLKPK